MKLKIIEKAYIVYHDGMIGYRPEKYQSWEDIEPVYAETPSKAKNSGHYAWDYEVCDNEYPEYLDLKVRRAKWADIVEYDGKVRKRAQVEWQIERDKEKARKRALIEKYPDDTLFYIQRGYVGNSVLWWELNSCGYTCKFERAQTYTKKEVLSRFLDGNPDDRIWVADHVKKNTTVVVDGQHLKGKFCIQ